MPLDVRPGDVRLAARLLHTLPTFLRQPVTREQARAILRRRLERREADFLTLARQAIYDNAASPYRHLLELVRCEYGDLEWLVSREGLEGALRCLYRQGVYLTIDEFKGRQPVRRGSASIAVDPDLLRNPLAASQVPAQTGGSRGRGTAVPFALASIRDRAVNSCLTLDAQNGGRWTYAYWGVPGSYPGSVLRYSFFGARLARWFSQVDPGTPGVSPRYRWSVGALRVASALVGVSQPRPVYVPVNQALPIARWMADVLSAGRTPHLYTYVSPALRLCDAARRAGLALDGAQFTVTGEPLTATRLAVIRGVGARAVPDYGSVDAGGFVSYGCLAPAAPDDLHFFDDLHALVQPGAEGIRAGLPATALLLSSLRPTAPLVLLNASMGDQAVVVRRSCGCALEQLGWGTHLHTVRSFEKLTAGGMTFLDSDVIRVLDETLPARFGGGPTDYQLVEEEADDGQPRLRLCIEPALGPLDDRAVVGAFLAALGEGAGPERVMALQWQLGGLLSVERRPPRSTASGKILHLFVERRD